MTPKKTKNKIKEQLKFEQKKNFRKHTRKTEEEKKQLNECMNSFKSMTIKVIYIEFVHFSIIILSHSCFPCYYISSFKQFTI